jgi:hypothetical protein
VTVTLRLFLGANEESCLQDSPNMEVGLRIELSSRGYKSRASPAMLTYLEEHLGIQPSHIGFANRRLRIWRMFQLSGAPTRYRAEYFCLEGRHVSINTFEACLILSSLYEGGFLSQPLGCLDTCPACRGDGCPTRIRTLTRRFKFCCATDYTKGQRVFALELLSVVV